jgi:Subtilase family
MRPVLAGLVVVVVPLLALTVHGTDRGSSSLSSSHLRRSTGRSADAGFLNATSVDRSLKVKQQAARKKKRVVVRYKNSEGKAVLLRPREQQQQQGLVGEQPRTVYHDFDDDNVLVLDLDDDEIQALSLNANIAAVEKDHRYYALGNMVRELSVNETRRLSETTPYGITMVQADLVPIGPYGVKICVADTGVVHHPDLPTSMNGADRTSSNGAQIYWDGDKKSHGTHTAGTVAAVKNNGIGVRGVAAGASLYITRALDDVGYARESDIYAAIKQCADAGAQVISLSLGGGGITSSFKSLIDNLYYQNDIVIVAGTIHPWRRAHRWRFCSRALPCFRLQQHRETTARTGSSTPPPTRSWWRWEHCLRTTRCGRGPTGATRSSSWRPVTSCFRLPSTARASSCTSSGPGRPWQLPTWRAWRYVLQNEPAARHMLNSARQLSQLPVPRPLCFQGLLRSYYPQCSNNQIRFAMAYTAKDLDDSSSDSGQGCDVRFGYGVVQAKAALNFLSKYSCASTWGRQAVLGGCGVTKKRNGS